MAAIIEKEFQAAGFSPEVTAAAIVNAMAESSLNPEAVGDNGLSVGLFQLHAKGGGKGMTKAARQDPVKNARRIISEAKAAKSFMALVKAGERRVDKLAAAFSTYVERPFDKPGEAIRRAATAVVMFPSAGAALRFGIKHGWKIGLTMALLSGVALLTWLLARRRWGMSGLLPGPVGAREAAPGYARASGRKVRRYPIAGGLLAILGATTVFYNSRNYFRVRRLDRSR